MMALIFNNLKNTNVIIFAGAMGICSYMIFQATLPPRTNILSYWMASLEERIGATRNWRYIKPRVEEGK